MAKKTGADFYTSVTTLLNGFAMDSTLFYDMLETARAIREGERPWMGLRKIQDSQKWNTSDTYLTPKTLPSDFLRLSREGKIFVFDNNQTWMTLTEIPMELRLMFKDDQTKFYIDHNSGQFYLCGFPDREYSIIFPYIVDNGAITANTTWLNFPSRYDMILAYDVAAMWRLGVDYDDINVRNADGNARAAERLFNAAEKWDNELALSAVTNMDYPTPDMGNTFVSGKINTDEL